MEKKRKKKKSRQLGFPALLKFLWIDSNRKVLKISRLNQEARKGSFSWENHPQHDALGIVSAPSWSCQPQSQIFQDLGAWGAKRLVFPPNLRLPLYLPHSLCENTLSICLKRIISAGCRTGSASPSGPTVLRRSLGRPAVPVEED